MHEVAEPPSVAFSVFVLSAACLTEIRDRGKFCIQRSTGIPPVVQIFDGGLCFRFPFETGINVSNKMIANVITHVEFEKVPKLRQLTVQVLVYRIETLLKLLGGQTADRIVSRVVVNVGKQDGLREGRFDVLSRAPIAVPAGSNLIVKRTVHAVLLRAKDICQV